MNRKLFSAVAVIIVITAALAVAIPLIQLGMASQSQTDSETDYGTECYVIATSTGPDTMINVPPVSFQFDSSNNVYVPLKPLDDSTKGVLNVHIPGDDSSRVAKLRVMISFAQPLSWALIEEIKLDLRPSSSQGAYDEYTLYDSSASASNGIASNPSLAINVKDGQYDFILRVAYVSEIKMDPRPYQGSNMVSDVLFVIEETTDPMNSKTISVILKNGTEDTKTQIVDMANSVLIKNPFSKSGFTFAGWELTKVDDAAPGVTQYYDDRDNIAYWVKHAQSSVELKADWGKKVVYNGGEGVHGDMGEQAVGSRSVTLKPLTITKQGYTFSEWVDNLTTTTKHYCYETG
ncbi:MAG: InlB B-repeat-containing protein [Candidatus Methanomethylophilaceae archaeon]|nr:InlB B-repeat-containing protein [Candidatus Methanomethylophilaceae archaeon]